MNVNLSRRAFLKVVRKHVDCAYYTVTQATIQISGATKTETKREKKKQDAVYREIDVNKLMLIKLNSKEVKKPPNV